MKLFAFDFDGTITTKDTFLEFIKFSKGHVAFWVGMFVLSPVLIAFTLKFIPNHKAKELVISYFFKGMGLTNFNNYAEAFIPVIEKMIRPKAKHAIEEYKSKHYHMVIVSASIENWIVPWAKKAGFNDVIATKIDVNAKGVLTGKLKSNNCYGLEKKIRFLQKYPDRNKYTLTVFGDSIGDKELMDLADESHMNYFA